jgi:hypothetical protein
LPAVHDEDDAQRHPQQQQSSVNVAESSHVRSPLLTL